MNHQMKMIKNKHQKILIWAVLLLIFWSVFNIDFNLHCHIGDNGNLIFHSHPYQKNNNKNQHTANHTHTQIEFIFLNVILNIFSSVAILVLLLFSMLKRRQLFHKDEQSFSFKSLIRYNITSRGPPYYTAVNTA